MDWTHSLKTHLKQINTRKSKNKEMDKDIPSKYLPKKSI